MEMAASDYETPETPATNLNHGGQRAQKSLLKPKSTTGGLLAGNGHNKGQNPQRGTQPCYIYCTEPHWSDQCSKVITLEARKEKLKGCCFNCLKSGHVLKDSKVDRSLWEERKLPQERL